MPQGKVSFSLRTPGPSLKYLNLILFKCKVLWILGIFFIINSKGAQGQAAGNVASPKALDVYGEIGESVTLPCTLDSAVINYVQWSRGPTALYSGSITKNDGFSSALFATQYKIIGDKATEFDLEVNSLSADDVAVFTCAPFGGKSAVITVKNPKLPVTLSADNEVNLIAGQSRVVLTCDATGADPTNVTFAWSQKGDYIPATQTSPSGTVVSNALKSNLTLDPLLYTDDAEFTCTVSNGYYKAGKAKAASKTLAVQFPPMEAPSHLGLGKEENIIVAVGTINQAFKIPYIANPGTLGGATYEWNKVGSAALPSGVQGTANTTYIFLSFDAIKEEFYGEYKLNMTNSAGSNNITTATLGILITTLTTKRTIATATTTTMAAGAAVDTTGSGVGSVTLQGGSPMVLMTAAVFAWTMRVVYNF